mmetsp:Transcript_806/g.1556  ORF Transcript_806/g.1556 Transcript_806/m.1556 type:complete len:256 (-) Transcript_806:420-1187(-)|eukprot:CAMPEP_0175145092 /NCGR_PEP_ID=MMETSP0087-20121206/14547_1 /TAXON_ID=136419 /ORGANISM="Unknown Unknown, Strain D1" /LENGTH=255 /DNA_ID=CAMNT_0016429737 /DNA_START=22 /DNA_END=789 /DNA_ORIENTATION=-
MEQKYQKMKVVELKAELRALGCPVSGNKAQLVERLLRHAKRPSSTFDTATPKKPKVDNTASQVGKNLDAIFDKYIGEEKDNMFDEGFASFLTDHGIDPEGAMSLAFAWKCKCERVGECSRKEFVTAMAALQCDTPAKITAELASMKSQLGANSSLYKQFYRWVFSFFLQQLEQGRKTLDKEQAVDVWKVVLAGHFPLLDKFVAFMEQHEEQHVNEDLWNQVYDFACEITPDLSNWEDDGAWPVAIDDFVASVQQQ